MRTHDDHGEFQLWAGCVPAIAARPEHLAVVRFELIQREGYDLGWLDLTFAAADRTAVVPGVLVDLVTAARSDVSAFLWPRDSGSVVDEAGAYDLARLLLPHVLLLTRARVVPLEQVIRLAGCAAFDAARAAGELGAAPLGVAIARMAPWIAAARLAHRGPVAVAGDDAPLGSAVLRRFGLTALGSCDPQAAAWYGLAPAAAADGVPEVSVAANEGDLDPRAPIRVLLAPPAQREAWDGRPIVAPLPLDVAFSFDPDDGPVVGEFWVQAPRRPAETPRNRRALARDVALRLTFIVRDDFAGAPDADTDELGELAVRARDAGATVDFARADSIDALPPHTLAVAFGEVTDRRFRGAVEALQRRSRPFVAGLQPLAPYADWHEAALFDGVKRPLDSAMLERYVRAYEAHGFAVEGVALTEPPRDEAAHVRFAAALAAATAILVSVTDSFETFRTTYGVTNVPLRAMLPLVPFDGGAGEVTTLCGTAPFAFAHAPAAPRSGLLTAALALRDTAIPFVIAAPVADLDYATTLRRVAGPRTIVVTDASEALLEALYRHAALFVDASLRPRGLARIFRAVRGGALTTTFAASPAARFAGEGNTIGRIAVAELRDTVVQLWHAPQRANRAFVTQTALGAFEEPEATVDQLLELFEQVAAVNAP